MAEMILTFEFDGKTVHKETKGFKGKDCVSKTKFVEEALGDSGKKNFKSEYYEEKQKDSNEKTKLRF